METGQYSEYDNGYCDGYNQAYNQAQNYRESKVGMFLDFDDRRLDSAVAKAERLKSLLIECRELAKELTNSTSEMSFDEFAEKISVLYLRVAEMCLNGDSEQRG